MALHVAGVTARDVRNGWAAGSRKVGAGCRRPVVQVTTNRGGSVRRSSGRSRRTLFGFAVAVLALGLVAAACGSDDSSSGSGTTAAGGAGTTAGEGAGTTAASTATPVPGGELIVGIEADTSSPWTPSKMVCAASCYQTVGSVYDPLVMLNEDGQPVPYLAESVEPNADYTVWTIKARSGVTFHDGTPFDGAAIADNLIRATKSFLTGAALTDIAKDASGNAEIVVTDPMTVQITMSRPWVPFPIYLSAQIGYMASPTWLKAADADATLEAKPVGTGAFIFKDYKPGESFTATRNPELLEPALPVPRRVRDTRHPRRARLAPLHSRPATSTSSTRRTATRSRSSGTSPTSSRCWRRATTARRTTRFCT